MKRNATQQLVLLPTLLMLMLTCVTQLFQVDATIYNNNNDNNNGHSRHLPQYNAKNPPIPNIQNDRHQYHQYRHQCPPEHQHQPQQKVKSLLPQQQQQQQRRRHREGLPLVVVPPSPPNVVPLRFLRAGKNDIKMGLQRYEQTLVWRKTNMVDALLLYESFPNFHIIKKYYHHYYHFTGYNNEPCFYEFPAQTNFQIFRQSQYNITLPTLLRHYIMIMEFQWQFLERNDLQRSIYIIDLDGITMRNVFSDIMEFIKQAMTITSQHYPERAGYIYILNVPTFFSLIWNTIRPLIDTSTLERIHILRRNSNSHNNKNEILQNLLKHIPIEHIPPIYGGRSVPLGYSPQERILQQFIEHRNSLLLQQNRSLCANCDPNIDSKYWPCSFCRFRPVRSY